MILEIEVREWCFVSSSRRCWVLCCAMYVVLVFWVCNADIVILSLLHSLSECGVLFMRVSVLFMGCVFAVLLVSVAPLSFGAYTVGVKAGDWIKYTGTVSGMESTDFMDFSQTSWIKSEVLSVSGTTVTLQLVAHFTNGSEAEVGKLVGDVATGSGNLTFLMPAGMQKGDSFPSSVFGPSPIGLHINDTVSRSYAGASRAVNVISMASSFGSMSFEFAAYWDQATGVLLELFTSTSMPGESAQISIKATETNMWSGGLFGDVGSFLSNNMVYIVVGLMGVTVVVVVIALLMMRGPRPVAVSVAPSAAAVEGKLA